MKKVIILILAVLGTASIALATGHDTSGYQAGDQGGVDLGGASPTSGTAPTMKLQSSKSVKLSYKGSDDGTGYIIAGSHTSGSKSYATSSGDTKIYSADGSLITPPTTVPTGTASATWDSNWTAQ